MDRPLPRSRAKALRPRRRRASWLVASGVLLIVVGASALADGKFYYNDEVPRGVPYQRALIFASGDMQTMVLQSTFFGTPGDVQWIVPLPSVPEVASVDAALLHHGLFDSLARYTKPKIVFLFFWIMLLLLVVVPALIVSAKILLYVFRGRSEKANPPSPAVAKLRRYHRAGLIGSIICIALGLWFAVDIPLLTSVVGLVFAVLGYAFLLDLFIMGTIAGGIFAILFLAVLVFASIPAYSGYAGLEIKKRDTAGPYEVTVLAANDSAELVAWLVKEGFTVADSDVAAFDDYIARDWVFATAKVMQGQDDAVVDSETLVSPLVLRFRTGEPVYPLALTGTAGSDTEILLYVFGRNRFQADDRLETVFAGDSWWPSDGWPDTEPTRLLPAREAEYPYLTKFEGTLSAEAMAEDLVFRRAANDRPHRKRIYR